MNNIFLLARKDFLRKWRNPVVLIGFTCIPLVFTLILGQIFGTNEKETLPRISTLIVDKDHSFLSELYSGLFKQGELNKLIDLKKVEEDEGRRLIDKGKASALLIIPEKFGENVWSKKPTEILLIKNPSEQFLPQVVEEVCDISSLLISSLFSVFSDELSLLKNYTDKKEIPDDVISSLSIQIKKRIQGISKYVFPPVISLKQRTIDVKDDKASLNASSYLLPAMAVMFLIFICNVVFEDILREKEKGTLLRMSVSPLKISDFIWSKILISALIGILCTLILILSGRIIFSIRWGNTFLVFLIVLCLNILIAGFISLLYSFIRTERQAGAAFGPVILVMSLLGGSMVPIENFPPFIQNFSKLTLNYWGIKAFHKTITRNPAQEIVPIIIGMAFAGIVFSFLGSYFLNKTLKKGLFK